MKIVHIITRLILGGAQENTLITCKLLAERGHDVMLITGPAIGPEGELFEQAKKETPGEVHRGITVNSSPYGVSFYRRLGFVPLEAEKEVNGMRITPMQFDLGSNQADG